MFISTGHDPLDSTSEKRVTMSSSLKSHFCILISQMKPWFIATLHSYANFPKQYNSRQMSVGENHFFTETDHDFENYTELRFQSGHEYNEMTS